MTKIIGRQCSVGIGKESVRGTAVAPTFWVPQMEPVYEDRVETVKNESSFGRIEGSDGQDVTLKYGEAILKSKIKDKNFGLILLSLFGSVGSVSKGGGNAAVYDHTFSVGQSTQHQSLSLAMKSPNEDVVMPNAIVDSLKINAEPGNYVMYEANFLGLPSQSASQTVAFAAENDLVGKHCTFKKASLQSGLDAASATQIRNFELEIKANAVLEQVLGTVNPADVLNQSFNVSGKVVLTHNDLAFQTLQNAGTYQALRFDMVNSGVTIGASANPGLRFDLYRVAIENYERKRTSNEIVEESFDFFGHYYYTDTNMIRAILTNLQTSY
ncbi:MAG: hypothetical protein E6R04_11890 [Spirochaetes bacterium]|nr:MAG: hypothetical protein E6R04_11890 [Spirochaetota bacterium]